MLSEHSTIHITVKFPCKSKIIDSAKPQLLPQLKLNHWFPGGKVTSLAKLLHPKISVVLSGKIKTRKEIFWFPENSSEKQDGKTENERWNSHLRLRATVKFFKNENTINHRSPAKKLLCFYFSIIFSKMLLDTGAYAR